MSISSTADVGLHEQRVWLHASGWHYEGTMPGPIENPMKRVAPLLFVGVSIGCSVLAQTDRPHIEPDAVLEILRQARLHVDLVSALWRP
jgi:hypothetical protein